MDQGQRAAFEGLLRMACLKQEGSVSVTDLLIFANSVDRCHVVAEATDDVKLGRFYAENDFIPELVDIPDDVFEKLDFAKIGREMRESEKCPFSFGNLVKDGKQGGERSPSSPKDAVAGILAITSSAYNDTPAQPQSQAMGAARKDLRGSEILGRDAKSGAVSAALAWGSSVEYRLTIRNQE